MKLNVFCEPFSIEGDTKKKLINKIKGVLTIKDIEKYPIYFWSKCVDGDFHPNDYLKIEDNYLEFSCLISGCGRILEIEFLFRPTLRYTKKNTNYESQSMQLKKVLAEFRCLVCKNKKDVLACVHQHYFMGFGTYKFLEKNYEGIHILSYPVENIGQDKQTFGLNSIKDPIYQKHLRWCKKNGNPTSDSLIQHRMEIQKDYLKQFRIAVKNLN